MTRRKRPNDEFADLDELIDEIIVDAYGEDEQLWAFRQAIEDEVSLPAGGFVIGQPVFVVEIDYEGNKRRGLTAKCRWEDGSEHIIAASDMMFPEGFYGARYLAAYRKWFGLEPYPQKAQAFLVRRRQHKATAVDLDLGGPIDLVVLSVKNRAPRCCLLGSERVVTLRPHRIRDMAPGEIVTVKPKQWQYAGYPYLSGEIESIRLDVAVLGLVPLTLEDRAIWDPKEHYWDEDDEPIEDWAKPIIAHAPRPEFEMEQVLPGANPDDPFLDPITEANDLKEAGNRSEAKKILMQLCQSDLRCLDVHAHLGNLYFDTRPEDAIRHYEVGLRIGELSLGEAFEGLPPGVALTTVPSSDACTAMVYASGV